MRSASIESLLKRWLPGQELKISRVSSGGSTEVYHVQSGKDATWLRLAEDSGENRFVEYRVHQMLRERGVHVPDILMFEAEPPELDRSAALTSTIPGIPLSECRDPEIARAVAEEAGRDLAIVNSLPVNGFGWIDRIQAGDPEIVAEHPLRAAWTGEYALAVGTIADAGMLDPGLLPNLEQSINEWSETDSGEAGFLAHGDFDTTHIYFDPQSGRYSGIIDFGEGRGADLEYDLGHLLLHDGELGRPRMFDSCLTAWGGDDSLTRRRAHLQAIAIATRQLAIFLGRSNEAYRSTLRERLIELLIQFVGENI